MAIWQSHSEPYREPCVLEPGDAAELEAFLRRDIPSNLYQLCWLENHGVRSQRRPDVYRFRGLRDRDGELCAEVLVITDRLVLVDAVEPSAARLLGAWYRRRRRRFQHIVSAARAVGPFWDAYRSDEGPWRVGARLDRDQQMFVARGADWMEAHGAAGDRPAPTGVRRARPDELEAVFLASARMHREETFEDPLESEPESFRRHVEHRIESGRCFVWFDQHRRLQFKADVSAESSYGVQISGVYTPPRLRGQGIATRAMFDIIHALFDAGAPRVTLYVNAENAPARRVYQKVGFDLHDDYQTVFIASTPDD